MNTLKDRRLSPTPLAELGSRGQTVHPAFSTSSGSFPHSGVTLRVLMVRFHLHGLGCQGTRP